MAAATEPHQAPREAWRVWLWLLALAALLPVAGLGGFVLGLQHEAAEKTRLPVLGEAPRYTLTNQLGEKVSSTSLLGRVQLVTFLFPYCTTLCPLIAAHLTNLEAEGLRPAGIADKVAIVSFNIDPGNTGPHEMRGFLRQYGWEPQDLRWQYLVGPPAEIRRVVSGGFSVWYKRVSLAAEAKSGADAAVQPEVENKLAAAAHANYDIVHNDVIELVDQRGRIRKVYDDADTVDWQDLLAQVQSLIDQRQ